jgi:hypothetical protein
MFLNGSPHAVTDLWDVGQHHTNVKFTCPKCGHWRIFHAAALWELFRRRRWSDHLSQVQQHFYCGVCAITERRKIRPQKMEFVSEETTGAGLPLPSRDAWKREAKRRR